MYTYNINNYTYIDMLMIIKVIFNYFIFHFSNNTYYFMKKKKTYVQSILNNV